MAPRHHHIVCFVFALLVVSPPPTIASSTISQLQKHLRRLNKPALSSIQSPDGDIIDCVLLSQQPAFDHPLLKNHKIQMRPNFPEQLSVNLTKDETSKPQLWHSVGSCPSGTIPVRRTTKEDILRANKMKQYGRKFHRPVQMPTSAASVSQSGHEHAIGYVQGGSYYGAKATISVWDPSVQVANEFSLSQLWILAGSFNSDLNSIEAGWQVSPDLYGDNNTRLFTYWTSDAYQATGCYNLLCSGFVQVSDQIAMGATISPVSSYNGRQYDITILIWKDPKAGNWWMQFGDKYVMGYWPSSLFTTLTKSAGTIEWGGEVVNSDAGGQHTTTQMGSGHFPSEGFGKSSYFSNLLLVDANNNLISPGSVSTFADKSNCYDVQSGSNSDWGDYFYYGGPGRNANCP